MATATTKSAARKAGILDNPYLAQAAIAEGALVSHGAAEGEAILPAATTGDMKLAGVNLMGGQPGATLVPGADMFAAQWHGRAKVRLKAGQTANRGDHAVPADTSGSVQSRTLYSYSQNVVGTFPQTKTAGSANDFIECDLAPRLVEIVRPVFGSASTAPGAATKYLSAAGTAVGSATAVALAVVPFTGCTIRNLFAQATTAPAGSDTGIVTVYRNPFVAGAYTGWAATTLTCTITGAAFSASDVAHSVVCNQGDLLGIQVVSSNVTLAGLNAQLDLT